jgi:hypothetical protein
MTGTAQQKVRADHLNRNAYLYIRQSTLRQVFENKESTIRQYDLRQRAVALGWPIDRIIVIDSDLGQSAATAADREGFSEAGDGSQSGEGRHRPWSGGLAAGTQLYRLASAAGDLRAYRYLDSR